MIEDDKISNCLSFNRIGNNKANEKAIIVMAFSL